MRTETKSERAWRLRKFMKASPLEIAKAPQCGNGVHMMKQLLPTQAGDGNWAEFGVAKGISLRLLQQLRPDGVHLWGFDSWLGIPEPWLSHDVGFHAQPVPTEFDADPTVTLVKGYFKDTLSEWVEDKDPLGFIHFDCDLYSSTKTVLDVAGHLIVPGTLLIFDEIHKFPTWEDHEWKAFSEWREEYDIRTECLGKTRRYEAAFKVLS